jgi:hypothetical protein
MGRTALNFRIVRPQVAVAGFTADADPRTNPPADVLTFVPQDRVSRQSASDDTKGLAVFVQFVDDTGELVVGPTADFTLYIFDEGSGSWVQGPTATASACNELQRVALIGKLFVQFNAIHATTGATKVNVFATELAILPVNGL